MVAFVIQKQGSNEKVFNNLEITISFVHSLMNFDFPAVNQRIRSDRFSISLNSCGFIKEPYSSV
jgi:hypothetical protein